MKRKVWLVMMVLGLAACSNNGKIEIKTDSLKQELDTSLGKIKDSVKAKGERTLDAVKEKLDGLGNKKDSVRDTTK
jgi:hypothetical protein